jgi:thymidylate synthase (FAD)
MHIELLYHTPDPERAIATAARLCYAPVGAVELMETMDAKRMYSVLDTVLAGGHFSTLEHASYTFAIEGVSRTLTHQLVRHRLASYEQQSQRYVKYKNGIEAIEPPSIADNPEASARFSELMAAVQDAYAAFLEMGIPAEDARYVLPNATETKLVMTMNARELRHFFDIRCCIQPRPVGDPRDGLEDARARAPHGPLRLRRGGSGLRARPLPRRQDGLRQALPDRPAPQARRYGRLTP